jgi:hypothetical protein
MGVVRSEQAEGVTFHRKKKRMMMMLKMIRKGEGIQKRKTKDD